MEQSFVQLTGAWVEQFGGGGDGVFAYLVACKHPRQRIGYKEYLLGVLQRRVLLAAHGVELEDAVEIHQLDACHVIDLPLRHHMFQVVVHGIEGDGIAVGAGIA